MNRYRWALVALAVAAAAAVLIVTRANPPPANTAGGGSSSLPAGVVDPSSRQSAPDFTGIQGWVNTAPLTLAGLRGRVVMVDFWTFSCVNCTRTFPHIHALLDTYGAAGLVVVGVHSPEFDFEKDPANVRAAVSRLGVTWPVALDPDMATWNAWSNEYWPAEYVIDRQGHVGYVNFGEGAYDQTAAAIAYLLGSSASPSAMPSSAAGAAPTAGTTSELYAGSQAASEHGDPGLGDGETYGPPGQVVDYPASAAPATQRDRIELSGPWTDRAEYVVSGGTAHIRLRFHARDLYVVVGSDTGDARAVSVTLDGGPVRPANAGTALDASGSTLSVRADDLYNVLRGVSPGDHVVDLQVPAGLRLYTFTFG